MLLPLRVQVRSLVGELRSNKLHGQKKKKNLEKSVWIMPFLRSTNTESSVICFELHFVSELLHNK